MKKVGRRALVKEIAEGKASGTLTASELASKQEELEVVTKSLTAVSSAAGTASGVMTIAGAATTSAGSYVIASDGTVSEMVSGLAR